MQSILVFAIIVWVLWVCQAVLSVMQVGRFSRIGKATRIRSASYKPAAVVIVPFKGVDLGLEKALESLCNQDYPDYRLVFVVESEEDAAYPALCRFAQQSHQNSQNSQGNAGSKSGGLRDVRVLVAGRAGPHEGQKVHNQLHALDELWDKSSDDEVWVFADSDAVPGRDWLSYMVDPLEQPKRTGMTTGYRWLVPEPSAGFWSHMASCMNSSVASWVGRDSQNFAWGGAMALRASTARAGDLRGLLTGALCDDYQFSRMVRSQGTRIYFVPKALVASHVDFTFGSLVNFAHRQYLLTRVYMWWLYYFALAVLGFYVLGFYSALAGLTFGLYAGDKALAAWAGSALVLVAICNQARAALRARAVRQLLGPEVLAQLKTTLVFDRWLTWFWMTLHFLLALRALFGRTMNWRGIRYRLYGPQRVDRL